MYGKKYSTSPIMSLLLRQLFPFLYITEKVRLLKNKIALFMVVIVNQGFDFFPFWYSQNRVSFDTLIHFFIEVAKVLISKLKNVNPA